VRSENFITLARPSLISVFQSEKLNIFTTVQYVSLWFSII